MWFISTGPSEEQLRDLKPQEVLQKMYPEDTNAFANGIIKKYAHRPDGLENACYADFAKGYVNINTKDVVEDDDIENYFTPVNSDEEKLSEGKIIVLKNGLGKMRKGTQSRVKRYHKFSELEDPELHVMTLLQLYMSWRNEEDLKRDCYTYLKKFEFVKNDIMRNIKKHYAFYCNFDLDDLLGEVLDGVDNNLLDKDEKGNGPNDHGMLNPDLLDLNSIEQGDPSQPSTANHHLL